MRSVKFIALFLLSFGWASPAFAVDPLTVILIKNGLDSALQSFSTTISSAAEEVKSVGASLQANAQNVIADIDTMLGKKLQYTTDKLTGVELQLVEDAKLLTAQLNQATKQMANNAGENARRAIADADITAYNASYSLPCRSQVPRVLYVVPSSVRVGIDTPEIKIRGNFLDLGKQTPKVTIGNCEGTIISRSKNEIVVKIPDKVLLQATVPQAVTVEIPAMKLQRSNYWLFCTENEEPVEPSLTAALPLRPAPSFRVSGTITGTYESALPMPMTHEVYHQEEPCDSSVDDNRTFCLQPGDTLSTPPFNIAVHSANCNSWISTPTIAGSRCVEVRGHIGGCGYNLFWPIRNCKGRGWIHYHITLNGQRPNRQPLSDYTFEDSGKNGKRNTFQFRHPSATQQLSNADWRYTLQLVIDKGNMTQLYSLGSGNQNVDGISTRMVDGTLYLTIPSDL